MEIQKPCQYKKIACFIWLLWKPARVKLKRKRKTNLEQTRIFLEQTRIFLVRTRFFFPRMNMNENISRPKENFLDQTRIFLIRTRMFLEQTRLFLVRTRFFLKEREYFSYECTSTTLGYQYAVLPTLKDTVGTMTQLYHPWMTPRVPVRSTTNTERHLGYQYAALSTLNDT